LCAELTNEDQYQEQNCVDDFLVNSFDPNDKTCMRKDSITTSQIDDLEKLTYLIRFGNTGSADAINIVISDTLDNTFINPSSIRIIDASHSNDRAIFHRRGININIFPNPSAGSFTIESVEYQNKITRIEWIDMDGKIKRVDSIDSQQFIFSRANSAPGLYSLRIPTDPFVQIQKVIIQ
jgi:uncharacterized repeat protein (TIGR01451 family)